MCAKKTSKTQGSLFYGDNLEVLKLYLRDESIDLIYLDPPFKSNRDYNVLFAEQDGSRSASQMKAFEDTWKWDEASARAYREVVESGGQCAQAMIAFRTFLGETDLLAYISMMAPRLIELKRVLKNTGSIYLHCDPTASHYLKMLMDSIFGPECFKNEIIWHYRKWPSGKYTFQRNHDVILFYSKSESKSRTFNQLYMERAASTLKRFGKSKIVSGHDNTGRRVPSKTEDEDSAGVRQDDVWDIGRVPPIKQLFPTEKPEALLERIIKASSNPGDIVLDPFCGCGTSVCVAQRLSRNWIGIDITHLAMTLIRVRLNDTFGSDLKFKVTGEPISLPDAKQLAEADRYQFQWWALGLIGARPTPDNQKKGADRGIDGRMYFHDGKSKTETKQIVISVKSGKVSAKDVRDLRAVIEREKASIGILITLENPTQPMRTEAASAPFYESPMGTSHPGLQIVTIDELPQGKRINVPAGVNVTFRKAAKYSHDGSSQEEIIGLL